MESINIYIDRDLFLHFHFTFPYGHVHVFWAIISRPRRFFFNVNHLSLYQNLNTFSLDQLKGLLAIENVCFAFISKALYNKQWIFIMNIVISF